jgi:hypothetical protein
MSPSPPVGTSAPVSSTMRTSWSGSALPSEVMERSGSSSSVHIVVVMFSVRP